MGIITYILMIADLIYVSRRGLQVREVLTVPLPDNAAHVLGDRAAGDGIGLEQPRAVGHEYDLAIISVFGWTCKLLPIYKCHK